MLYLATLTHGVSWDDAAELAAGVARLGVVHPTGYPPYMLLGHVFTLIEPIGSDATRANAWSAVCAALAIALGARLVLVRGGSLLGAAIAALLVTVAPVLWFQATVASAYPFLMLSIVLLITAGDAWLRRPDRLRLAYFAAAIGLVLMAHKTGVFFAAGAVAVMVLHRQNLSRRSLLPMLAILIPLATMLYIPLRENWHGWPNLIGNNGIEGHRNLFRWITGTAENITEADTLGANKYAVRVHSERFVIMMIASLSPAALVLVPAGLRRLWRDHSYMLCGLLPSIVSSIVILTTPGAFAYRHVGVLMTGAIACGIGLGPVLEWLRERRVLPVAAVAGLLLLLVAPASGIYYLQRSHREAQDWARATLASLPHGAHILTPWSALAPLRAVQQLDGYRRDVIMVEATGEPWKTDEWTRYPNAYAAGVTESRKPIPGTVQLVPTTGLNLKGLSGLAIGPIQVGYPFIWARTLKRTGG